MRGLVPPGLLPLFVSLPELPEPEVSELELPDLREWRRDDAFPLPELVPVESLPDEPMPEESLPVEPVPFEPLPVEPVPVEPVPFEPVSLVVEPGLRRRELPGEPVESVDPVEPVEPVEPGEGEPALAPVEPVPEPGVPPGAVCAYATGAASAPASAIAKNEFFIVSPFRDIRRFVRSRLAMRTERARIKARRSPAPPVFGTRA